MVEKARLCEMKRGNDKKKVSRIRKKTFNLQYCKGLFLKAQRNIKKNMKKEIPIFVKDPP
jgi:hypothetical protein